MMNGNLPEDREFLVTFSDLKLILKRSTRKIFVGAMIGIILGCSYTLAKTTAYSVEGTFREKVKGSGDKSLTSYITGSSTEDSKAILILKSRRILEDVVRKLDLQGTIQLKDWRPSLLTRVLDRLDSMRKNLFVEYAYLMNARIPVYPEKPPTFELAQIEYEGEIPMEYTLYFDTDETFSVFDGSKTEIGTGKAGEAVDLADVSFTVLKIGPEKAAGEVYSVAIDPVSFVAKNLMGSLQITTDKRDKTLLKIDYTHPVRAKAMLILNSVMEGYRSFLIQDHLQIVEEHVKYLKMRQGDMDRQLYTLMEEHAENISSNISNMEFFVTTMQAYKSKLINLDLEIKHLLRAQQEGSSYYNRYASDKDPVAIHNTMAEIRRYKQQCDSIDIVLRNQPVKNALAFQEAFNQYVSELEVARLYSEQAKEMLASLDKGEIPESGYQLISDPHYMVKPWVDHLEDKKFSEDAERFRAHFAAFLANLIHLLEVHEKTMHDRLTHQQNPQSEFQGIDLDTATTLYISYSKELHELEAELMQNEFLIEQIYDPGFEITSLTTVLTDSVSREMITGASAIILALKDETNRTQKEQERLKHDLNLQRDFLTLHLKEIGRLLHLREDLLKGKIMSLQNVTLELLQQKISILEKHLADFTESRLNNLRREKEVIVHHQAEMQKEVESMPSRWASEKLIDQHLEANQRIVHEIASLIETKNISEQLELSQSAPFDYADKPLHPRDPHLFLFALLGAFTGGFFTLCFCLAKGALAGVPASPKNLILADQQVAGFLSRGVETTDILTDDDLGTLRRLSAQLSLTESPQGKTASQSLLLMCSRGPDYAAQLALLMAKRGLRVLILPLTLDKPSGSEELPGILQVLEKQAERPEILKGKNYDRIATGGICRYASELIESSTFTHLMQDLMKEYDRVIAVSSTDAAGAEAEGLLKLFNHVAVSLDGEMLDQLIFYMDAAKTGKKVSFVFV